jgi:metal-responsive CopG/Arc/MetJ family transcriptional regulator
MKTAVSLPDALFQLAETEARREGVSRSQLYATALSEFLERRRTNSVTEQLNRVYSTQRAKLDSGLSIAQFRSLKKEEW